MTSDDQPFDGANSPWPRGMPGQNVLISYGLAPLAPIPDDPAAADALLQLDLLGSRVVLAGSVGLPARVDSWHGDGVFVLYADSAVRFATRDRFDNDLALCTALDAAFNLPRQRVWDELVRR